MAQLVLTGVGMVSINEGNGNDLAEGQGQCKAGSFSQSSS